MVVYGASPVFPHARESNAFSKLSQDDRYLEIIPNRDQIFRQVDIMHSRDEIFRQVDIIHNKDDIFRLAALHRPRVTVFTVFTITLAGQCTQVLEPLHLLQFARCFPCTQCCALASSATRPLLPVHADAGTLAFFAYMLLLPMNTRGTDTLDKLALDALVAAKLFYLAISFKIVKPNGRRSHGELG